MSKKQSIENLIQYLDLFMEEGDDTHTMDTEMTEAEVNAELLRRGYTEESLKAGYKVIRTAIDNHFSNIATGSSPKRATGPLKTFITAKVAELSELFAPVPSTAFRMLSPSASQSSDLINSESIRSANVNKTLDEKNWLLKIIFNGPHTDPIKISAKVDGESISCEIAQPDDGMTLFVTLDTEVDLSVKNITLSGDESEQFFELDFD